MRAVCALSNRIENVNASTRALSWSTTLDGRSAASSPVSDVLAHAADPTGLVASVRETIREKTITKSLLKETEDTCTAAAGFHLSSDTSSDPRNQTSFSERSDMAS